VLSAPPANPMSVELTVSHRRVWWQPDDDLRPEAWEVSADVSALGICPPELRHVADLSATVADLRRGRVALDALVLGDWAPDFLASVAGDDGDLRPELAAWIADGPPRVVVLRGFDLTPEWRGQGLGPVLLAGALAAFQPLARLAAFRVEPPRRGLLQARGVLPGRPGPPHSAGLGRAARERVAERLRIRRTAVLERLGFRTWDGVHVADLRGAELADARQGSLERWEQLDWR
jgi:GNAT superfamily N-acetyltransferase